MSDTRVKVKHQFNNTFDTEEIHGLLQGNESLTAKEFVCKCILNIEQEEMSKVLEN